MTDISTNSTTETTAAQYAEFLATKRPSIAFSGFEVAPESINPKLFHFQRDIVRWALRLGKAALFEECGLGKTAQQLEWARHIVAHTGGRVIIMAPLAVAHQTIREGEKFGVPVVYATDQAASGNAPVVITNYERLDSFDPQQFIGVVLDESSILKSFTGKTKRALLTAFEATPYKLACTATPAPNDYLELGNHSEFLNVMPSNEMISRWFINNTMEAGDYRLKKHAEADFWRWLTSWAVCLSQPHDLGEHYRIEDFKLPPMHVHEHLVEVNQATIDRAHSQGMLLPDSAPSSTELHRVKRDTLTERVAKAVDIIASLSENAPYIVWCETNDESDALMKALPEAVEVRGSHTVLQKETRLSKFSDGEVRGIITKPDIAGFGLNWQHCANQIFVGVAYSFERFYQSIRRSYRFGQTQEVHAHLIYGITEGNVVSTLRTKEAAFAEMQTAMNEAMHEHGLFRDGARLVLTDIPDGHASGANWDMHLGDCTLSLAKFADDSIDFSVYSPPFAELYIYSDSIADMGNSADYGEFFKQYDFLAKELYRVMRPGRLVAVHCKDLPKYMNRDGAAGLIDFPGDLIKSHERAGFTFHSRVTIWKDPVIEMQRTKNHGLLHKNFTERAEACRQGMADYLIVFRKWPIDGGVNVNQRREVGDYIGTQPPVLANFYGNRSEQLDYSIAVWQRYASPVWFDIDQTNVLNYKGARSEDDEKHICPLQLDVIERAIDLWTNKGELVLTPFAGIGSELFCAVKLGRRAVGIELKPEYFNLACKTLREQEALAAQPTLFDLFEADESA